MFLYSLEFQVVLFLRKKLVECYIGVEGVHFDALGHLNREGSETKIKT